MKLSIVLPVHNEAKNIRILHQQLEEVCQKVDGGYEIIFVNDGSTDGSTEILDELAVNSGNVKVVHFLRNFGQTAATSAGIRAATGQIIIPMDADLQNDPADIPRFLEKISSGYSVVSGWRKNRKDNYISRKIPSLVANWIIGLMTGTRIHDYGCSIKAYKREVIQGVQLYGEMHRFIAAYAAWSGGKVTEIEVHHRPRVHGQTHYGISRTFRVLLDLVVVIFLSRYMNRPMHFFGGLGFVSFAGGLLAGCAAVAYKLTGTPFVSTPLPVFSALLLIVGVQLIAIGVVSEMLMRIYYEAQHKTPYTILRTVNFSE